MSTPPDVQAKLDLMVLNGWITGRQSERVLLMVKGGSDLEDALTSLPILATKDLKKAFDPSSKSINSSAAVQLPTAQFLQQSSPASRQTGEVRLDEDLIATGEMTPLPDEESFRPTDTAIPVSRVIHRDPKELISLSVQEPAGSVLPGEEADDTADSITPLADMSDLDLDLEDFDFGDHSAPSTDDLDDDLILPDDPTPASGTIIGTIHSRPRPTTFETDVSSLLDEVFEFEDEASGEAIPTIQTPPLLKLPSDPATFMASKSNKVLDLGADGGDLAQAEANNLLGESLILGRRGLRIDPRKSHQNVALYDPDGKLEEERSLPESVLRSVFSRVAIMVRVDSPKTYPARGHCRMEFQGEKGRALGELEDADSPLTIYLMTD